MSTLKQLYALTIPAIQELFLEVMKNVVDRAVLNEMIVAIQKNDIEALYVASGFTPVILEPILEALEGVYKEAAKISLPDKIKTSSGIKQPLFNVRNIKVEQDLKKYSSTFITRIENDVRDNLRVALAEGLSQGNNPKEIARQIVGKINPVTKSREGGLLGLSPVQVKWSFNARKYLNTLDKKYLTLELRDKRFDSIVKKSIENNKPLNEETISKLVTSYNNKALKYRGEMISRTETIQALNRGEYASIRQMVDDGSVSAEAVKKWWDDTGDSRTRIDHMRMGKIYNRENAINFNEVFVFPNGDKMMFPGDISLGASGKEIINCRCKAQYKVKFYNG